MVKERAQMARKRVAKKSRKKTRKTTSKKTATKSGKAPPCPECGGAKRGRGYIHKKGCALAPENRVGGTRRKTPTRTGRTAQTARTAETKVDGRVLRGMSVTQLVDLHERIKTVIKRKLSDVDRDIKESQALKQKAAAIVK